MNEINEHIQQFFLLESGIRALIASILVGGLCGLLGCFLVLRNMSLIGDALSHAILPGIVVAFVLFGYSTMAFFGGSVIAGLISAFMITWLQRNIRVKNDAAIGIIFSFMFSLGVIGISWLSHHEGVHLDLKDFLFGNILAVETSDVVLTFIMVILVLSMILIFYRSLFVTSFQSDLANTLGINANFIHYLTMFLLSLSVVASLRSVGVILVVSMLITPASAALLISDRLPKVLASSVILGMISSMTGLLLSISFDFPPGPSMAVVTTLIYIFIMIFAPQRGLFSKWRNRRNHQMREVIEDILKLVSKQKASSLSIHEIAEKSIHSERTLSRYLGKMQKLGLVKLQNSIVQLSEDGQLRAHQLIRAHRLWEVYLVEQLGLDKDQIHEEAEKFEHQISEEEIREMDESLGYPETDPHGSPIPRQ
ncbi:MAG: iron chelate uptake ABC transporter family permease subunit [Saprospiraceae bacterium]|nr:iron chelate uptake ABC transporter family permease subunit [Saprospiraceae bacterium]